MRTNEFTGVYHMHEEISPEAYKAQRLQELADLAEYRSRHLAAIQAWSCEEKRLERQAQHHADDLEARRIANERAKNDPEYIRSLMSAEKWVGIGTGLSTKPVYEKLTERLTMREIAAPEPKKRPWWKLWGK